ncbi:MAG: DUF4340 domain-containing protein [Oscillospiraceae bacterium]
MSKNVKMLIAGISCIVLLSGGIVALKLTEPKEEDTDSASVSETENNVIYEEDSIKSVSVENDSCSYTIIQTTPATDENSAEYSIEELKNVPLNTSIINNLPETLKTLSAEKIIDENASDLEQYGLAEPDAKIKITAENGSEHTLLIGNDTPTGNIYACMENETKVFALNNDTFSVFRYDTDYFISLVCIEEPESVDDYPVVNSLQIERDNLEYPIRFEYDEENADSDYSGGTASSHIMTSPVFAYVDIGEGSISVTHGMFGLTAASVFEINPDENAMEFAGLNEPSCTVTMDTDDGKETVLKIGNSLNLDGTDYYMGYIEGIDIIYAFTKDSLPWLDMQPLDIASSIVVGTYFYDIGAMTIETNDKKLEFTTEGDEKDNFSVKLDGEDYDTERFQNFYKYLIQTQAEEIYLDDPSESDLICSIKIKRNDGKSDETVQFYKGDGKTVIIKHNGVTSFINRINYDYVNVLLENIEKINSEEDFINVWK